MPAKHSSTCIDHAVLVVSQHTGARSSSDSRPRRDNFAPDIMSYIPLAHCQIIQDSRTQATTDPLAGKAVTLDGRYDLECQHVPTQGSVPAASCLQLPDPPVPSLHDNPAPASMCESPIENCQSSAGEERGSEDDVYAEPKLKKAVLVWLTVFVISLIAVPGIILGVLKEQVEMGIALSGAVATVVGIFAGLYCYSKKG